VFRSKLKLPKLGLPLLPLLGAVMLAVGPFLTWASNKFATVQGFDWKPATALYVFSALAFTIPVLAKENDRRLSAALTFLGALSLALVFYWVYGVFNEPGLSWGDVREGFYVTGVGAFFTTLAGCPLFRRIVI